MPRKKQDCPRRMKWEEEQALLAAAAAAASRGETVTHAAAAAAVRDDDDDDDDGESSDAPGERSDEGSEAESDLSEPPTMAAKLLPSSWESVVSNLNCNEDAISPRSAGSTAPAVEGVLDFSVSRQRATSVASSQSDGPSEPIATASSAGERPLDLSVPKRCIPVEEQSKAKRLSRVDENRPISGDECDAKSAELPRSTFLSPWDKRLSNQYPAVSSAVAASLPKLMQWNTALHSDDIPPSSQKLPPYKPPSPGDSSRALERIQELTKLSTEPADVLRSLGARTNVWQNQWMNRGAEQTRDVLKCVWCKLSFDSLGELTTHMKEAKHGPLPASSTAPSTTPLASSSASSESSSSLKETMQLPRKLVRGQDVWLGKGAEQTRQILKCMWCGQSFKSLDEMTVHMQKTQHYTNIISQEQIISWKSPDNKVPAQSHVNAVLTCKVCDQAFTSLKELSSHMVKYSHYKEHIMRSISETGGRRRQAREKRKKSLPVRKLLELERAHNEIKSEGSSKGDANLMACEKCGEKFEPLQLAQHIRFCTGKPLSQNFVNEPMKSGDIRLSSDSTSEISQGKVESPNVDPRSALSALERLIETSLNPRQRNSSSSSSFHQKSPSVISGRHGSDRSVVSRNSASSPGVATSLQSLAPRPRSRESTDTPSVTDSRYESDAAVSEPDRLSSLRSPAHTGVENGLTDSTTDGVDFRVHKEASERVSSSGSPGGSERAITPRSDRTSDCSTPAVEDLSGAPSAAGPANPLAALQKLCDKTDSPAPRTTVGHNPQDTPGAILAFSWACNDAVMTDSIMKCAFCDTPFISKGAYRHHLSKMHFVKDGGAVAAETSGTAAVNGKSNGPTKPRTVSPHSSSNSSVDDTPHSKFLKYSELAKQLSSKHLVE